MFLIFLLIIVVVIAAIAMLVFNSNKPSTSSSPSPSSVATVERTLFDLQVGDIVQHLGIDWVVEGQLVYDDGGYQWQEYLLQDGDRRVWLSVDEDDWVEVHLVEPISTLEISESPPPQELVVGQEIYRCTDSGTATMRRIGRLHRPNAETCRYFDYDGPGDRVLSIEDWDGDIEVCIGEKIQPSSLTILPGDGQSVHG